MNLRDFACGLGRVKAPSSSRQKEPEDQKPIENQAPQAGLPHAFGALQQRPRPRRKFDPETPHRASVHLEVKARGPLAPAGTEEAKGVMWNEDAGTLLKFVTEEKKKRKWIWQEKEFKAVLEAREHYERVKEAAHKYLHPQIAEALVEKLCKDADVYCHPKDTVFWISHGNEEVIERCKMFYRMSKAFLELTAKSLDDPEISKSKKEAALITLEKNLGECEMAVQNAFATAFQELGGFGGIPKLLQQRRKMAFDGLVEEFVQYKQFCWAGHWTEPSDARSADSVIERRRRAAEVHVAPALARHIGVDKALGIYVGVGESDQYASTIQFKPEDLSMMVVRLRDAVRLPKLISTWTQEVCTDFADLLRGKLRSKSSASGPDDVFGRRLRDEDMEPGWYEDLAQHAATTMGIEYLSAILSVDMDDGTFTLSRNTGALQRQIVDSLADEKDSLFRDELVVHEAAHTEGFLLERRGPVWTVRDREDGGGYAAEFRSLRLKDLAALHRADPASGTAGTAWARMARENRELLCRWVMEVNRPAFYEEMLEILRQPGAFREAITGPLALHHLLIAAASIAASKNWERAKVASQPNGDPASLDILMMFFRETDPSRPGTQPALAISPPDLEPVVLEQLARTGRAEAIAELLAAGRLRTLDPVALLDSCFPDKSSREWLQLELLCRPARFIDLRSGDNGLPAWHNRANY